MPASLRSRYLGPFSSELVDGYPRNSWTDVSGTPGRIRRNTHKGREIIEGGEGYQIREEPGLYKALFGAKKSDIGPKNTYSWDINTE